METNPSWFSATTCPAAACFSFPSGSPLPRHTHLCYLTSGNSTVLSAGKITNAAPPSRELTDSEIRPCARLHMMHEQLVGTCGFACDISWCRIWTTLRLRYCTVRAFSPSSVCRPKLSAQAVKKMFCRKKDLHLLIVTLKSPLSVRSLYNHPSSHSLSFQAQLILWSVFDCSNGEIFKKSGAPIKALAVLILEPARKLEDGNP